MFIKNELKPVFESSDLFLSMNKSVSQEKTSQE